MKKSVLVLLVAAISFAAACSKSSPEATVGKTEAVAVAVAGNTGVAVVAGNAGAGATQIDAKKICEHIAPIASAARKSPFSQQACEREYQGSMFFCRNASAVTECYTKIKSWDERLACFDSCVRDTVPAK